MERVKLCFLLCIFGVTCEAQTAGHGIISGTVIDVSSGDPVRKAIVTATWRGTPRAWATTRTDGSGRFQIEGLPAGSYDLRATRGGLGTAVYGAASLRELGDPVVLAEGDMHADVKLHFFHSATIAGRVVDSDGDPVSSVNVMLMRPVRNLGERTLNNSGGAQTDDRGDYKITVPQPGEYYLRATPQFRGGPMTGQDIIIPQYFGGAADPKDATPIVLRGTETLTGFDFHLTSEKPAQISGRVSGVPASEPAPEVPSPSALPRPLMNGRSPNRGTPVMVTIAPEGDMLMGSSSGATNGPDYVFQFPGFAPGRYRVQATFKVKDKTFHASQSVEARSGPNEVLLSLLPAVDLKGHLKVEGPANRPPESFTVSLVTSGPRRETFSGRVNKEGNFTIPQVPPGEWTMNVTPSPASIFDKSVHLGDRDFLYKRLEIPPGCDVPLNIVLSSATGNVEGEIDAPGVEIKRAGILLEPVGTFHTLARFYYSAVVEDNGKFKITGVAPGKYKIFALEKIATASYRNQESAELLEALGEDLEVTEGAKVQSHPKLIPQAKAKEILKP